MTNGRGIIVGCDEKAAWMLPWWWHHYKLASSYPVTFIDFGLSEKSAAWCKEKGQLLSFDRNIDSILEATSPPAGVLDQLCGPTFREHRRAWFKKPFACQMSPYEETLWIDLDCLILKPIEPIFSYLTDGHTIALAKEPHSAQVNAKKAGLIESDEILYNSGVLAFRKGSNVISAWINILNEPNRTFPGDQDALSKAIFVHKLPVRLLPPTFNWPWYLFFNPNASIVHFMGDPGKQMIRQNMDALQIKAF